MISKPNGQYPFGEKLLPNDGGRLCSAIVADRNARVIIVDFGTVICWVACTPKEALIQAQLFRSVVNRNWGDLSYNDRDFPIVVETNEEKQVIFSKMPEPLAILAANPEVYLVWADKLEVAAKSLLS
jgi:hypothetical protein